MIIFKLGGGHIPDGAEERFNLFFGSVYLDNPDVLAYFAWVVFFWFLFQFYWQSDHEEITTDFIIGLYQSRPIRNLIKNNGAAPKKVHRNKSLNSRSRYINFINGNILAWRINTGVENDGQFIISLRKPTSHIAFKVFCFIYASLSQQDFARHYLPYLIAAITLTLYFPDFFGLRS